MTKEQFNKKKFKISIFYAFYFLVPYLLTNHLHLFPPRPLPLTAIDQALPLIPWTIWIYISEYFLFVIPVIMIKDEFIFKKMIWSFFICFTFSYLVFIFYPTTFIRTPIEASGLTALAFQITRFCDSPANCLPSLHVTLVYLVSIPFIGYRNRLAAVFIFWATAIAISTMTTDHHYFLDVITGFSQAIITYTAVSLVFNWQVKKKELKLENLKGTLPVNQSLNPYPLPLTPKSSSPERSS